MPHECTARCGRQAQAPLDACMPPKQASALAKPPLLQRPAASPQAPCPRSLACVKQRSSRPLSCSSFMKKWVGVGR